MKVTIDYALSSIKANKKNAIALFSAIVIAALFLTATLSIVYNTWLGQVAQNKDAFGSWHAGMVEWIPVEKLPILQQHASVDKVLYQTDWQDLRLEAEASRPYIISTSQNEDAWLHITPDSKIKEGRKPQNPGEVVVSTLFLKDNPQYSIGDTLEVEIGTRMIDGRPTAYSAPLMEGEEFRSSGSGQITIVGSIDMQGSSEIPGYFSMGYADESLLRPDDKIRPYVQLRDMRKAYEIMPQLAEALELRQEHDGSYIIRYNSKVLSLYGIQEPGMGSSELTNFMLMGAGGLAAVMLLFITIIYSAFSVGARTQTHHLGILKSVGATPRQIRRSVLMQALIVSAPAIPIGCGLGAAVTYVVYILGNKAAEIPNGENQMALTWWVFALAALACLITVFFSAIGPGRKASRLSPIAAIRDTDEGGRIKTAKTASFKERMFGIEGELSANALRAHRRSRTASMISLSLSLVLMAGMFLLLTGTQLSFEEKLRQDENNFELQLRISTDPDDDMMAQLYEMDGVERAISSRHSATLLPSDSVSLAPELMNSGGVRSNEVINNSIYDDNGMNYYFKLIGLDEESFEAYCNQIGADYDKYSLPEEGRVILFNNAKGNVPGIIDKYSLTDMPFLDIKAGDTLELTEYGPEFPSIISVTASDVTMELPPLDKNLFPYDLAAFMPMETFNEIISEFEAERALINRQLEVQMLFSEAYAEGSGEIAGEILASYLPDSDYGLKTHFSQREYYALMTDAFLLMAWLIGAFFAVVGLFSAVSAVSGSMKARRREFSILRSVGMEPKGLRRMLRIEAWQFALLPVLISLLLMIPVTIFMSGSFTPSVSAYALISNAPWMAVIAMTCLIIAAILLVYRRSYARIVKTNIADSIRGGAV